MTARLKGLAQELGFPLTGVCPAVAAPGASRLREWLARGYAGQMHYLAARLEAYEHPRHVLEGVRSVLMLGLPYSGAAAEPCGNGQGRVARYAWGSVDYHDLIRERLHQLADDLRSCVPAARTRGVVDTAPLLEREFAQLAGLGWIGKNTLLLNRARGSYFLLAALLTDVELEYDAVDAADHCGTCTACLDACPTQAFPQPYVLDASRCISYLTIEHRESIAPELRSHIGDWLFGCDVCQEVCPWNRFASATPEPAFAPLAELNPAELNSLFWLTDDEFRTRYRRTPLWRPGRRGLLRNAALALGNGGASESTEALSRGLGDAEPLVREACAWALGRVGGPAARDALERRQRFEDDPLVRAALATSLAALDAPPRDAS